MDTLCDLCQTNLGDHATHDNRVVIHLDNLNLCGACFRQREGLPDVEIQYTPGRLEDAFPAVFVGRVKGAGE